MIALQAVVASICVALLVAFLLTRGKHWDTRSTLAQLLLWYPLSAPWLLVRAPLLYLFVDYLGMKLWVAIVLEFIVERPLFFLTAREIAARSPKKEIDPL